MKHQFNFCPNCATELQQLVAEEDGGPKVRTRCPACHWTACSSAVISSPTTGTGSMSPSNRTNASWDATSASVSRLPSALRLCATLR